MKQQNKSQAFNHNNFSLIQRVREVDANGLTDRFFGVFSLH